MEDGIIRCTLSLVVTLTDSVSGLPVDEGVIRFVLNSKPIKSYGRGEGCYIFMEESKENGLMLIEVEGYVPKKVYVDYEKLDPRLPSIDVFLIPSENSRSGFSEGILTLKGTLSGIERIEAINPMRGVTSIREFDAKKKIMTVFSPNRRINLSHTYYGILNVQKNTFEDIVVKEELPGKGALLAAPLEEEFTPNAPICRIIFGQVEEDGSYMLSVRDDATNLKYLVKFVVNGVIGYKIIDFHGNLEDEIP